MSRSAFVRALLRRAGPLDEQPSYPEALLLLARSARAGKVQAQLPMPDTFKNLAICGTKQRKVAYR